MGRKCCVPTCKQTHDIFHCFPNPRKDRERFKTWVLFIGGEIVGLDDQFIFKNRKICHSHFEEKYFGPNKRITNNSVPRLNLSGDPQKQPLHGTSNIAKHTTSPVIKAIEKSANETADLFKFKEVYTLSDKQILPCNNDSKSAKDNSHSTILFKEGSLNDLHTTPIEEKIKEGSLNNNIIRPIKNKALNNCSIRPNKKELLDKHPFRAINERMKKQCLFQIRKERAVQYFNDILTEKDDETLNNSIYSILLAYEMEKVPAVRKFECYNALLATMHRYITKI